MTEPLTMEFEVHARDSIRPTAEFQAIENVAKRLLAGLRSKAARRGLERANRPGVHSREAQSVVADEAEPLGFRSEKKGLFAEYETSALRPDMYLAVGSTGIILEVERGKTLKNNMDLLDFWKCHICERAHYLFLFVPQVVQRSNETERPFQAVVKRLGTFFVPGNDTNVRAVFIFGY